MANMDDLSKFDVQSAVEGLRAAPRLRPYSALQQKNDKKDNNNLFRFRTRPQSAVAKTSNKLNPHYYDSAKFMQTRMWEFDDHFK